MWLLFALSGPIFWAVSTHIDKYVLEKYFKHGSVAVSMVFTGIVSLVALPFIAFFAPGVLSLDPIYIAAMIISGLFYMCGMLFYLYALRTEEASIVAMVSPVGPIVAYALAYLFLGERLSPTQMLGADIIIAGAFLASLRFSNGKISFRKNATTMMTIAIFCLAFSSVIFKFFAVAESFWLAAFWTYVGEVLFGAGILLFRSERKIFMEITRSNLKAVFIVNGVNELINLSAGLGTRFALMLAPLALVQAVTSTTPIFTFLFAIIITVFLPIFGKENLSKSMILQKAVAAVLAVAGIWLAGTNY
jgi:drug/metabolite transporter (DMT)-like permease